MSDTAVTESIGSSTTVPTSSKRWRTIKATVEGLLYLAPTLLILGIFTFLPIITSFRLSLNRVAPFGNQTRYVGLDNYSRLLNDPAYWDTVRISLIFTVATVVIGLVLAIGLAIALSVPVKRLSWFHRLLIFVPIVISSAVTGVLFRWLYNPVVGYVNYWLSLINIEGPNWLASKDWALVAIILAVIWNQLGFNVIIALAGVQNIDSTYYEAAKVDGANVWDRIRHITLPLLTPTIFFLSVINIINSLQIFGQIEVLTQGGPGQATSTLIYNIYYDAFVGTPQRGIASAQAYLLAILILVITLIQFRGGGRRVHYQ
jgi:sn-glycerol 3-phosphate transport system permease protein